MDTKSTPKSLLFTLSTLIYSTRHILMNDYGMSEAKANMGILIAVDVEKQFNELIKAEKEPIEKMEENSYGNKSGSKKTGSNASRKSTGRIACK